MIVTIEIDDIEYTEDISEIESIIEKKLHLARSGEDGYCQMCNQPKSYHNNKDYPDHRCATFTPATARDF